MSPATWRWLLASAVVVIWGSAILADAISTSYTLDPGLHTGCGIILGVILGSAVVGKKDDGSKS